VSKALTTNVITPTEHRKIVAASESLEQLC
jgi:hypothetical protein